MPGGLVTVGAFRLTPGCSLGRTGLTVTTSPLQVPILIPCHRVVCSSGAVGNYGGGVAVKEWLLAHEGKPPRGERASTAKPQRGVADGTTDC